MDHLKKIFEKMRHYQLKLSPLKCAFGVHVGNFLGFLVHQRGIEVDQNKAKTISSTKAPQNKKELQKFVGQVNYLRRLISNLASKTKEFSDMIKEYFSKPSILMPLIQGHPLKLYLSVANESIGCLLASNNSKGHE